RRGAAGAGAGAPRRAPGRRGAGTVRYGPSRDHRCKDGDGMAATTGSGRTRVSRRTYAAACCSLALLLTGAAAGSSAADAAPTPLPSAGGTAAPVRLPVIPTGLDPQALKGCTKASPTVAHTVPWAQQSLELLRAGQLSSGAGVTVAVVDTGVSR